MSRRRRAASRSFARPVRGWRTFSTVACILMLWAAVAHQSGSGWVQAVGAVVAGLLLVGLFAPVLAVRSAGVAVTGSPADATAGQSFTVQLGANKAVRVRPIDPAGEPVLVAPSTGAALDLVRGRRGVVERIVVQIESAWPFGLLWWARRVELALPLPLHVAPRLGRPLQSEARRPGRDAGATAARRAPTGELRGTREYRPGDDRRRVHWPVSAHAGQMMVSEHEQRAGRMVAVRADLPGDPEAAEERASQVLASVIELIDGGDVVVLETVESGRGLVTSEVPDARLARRRMARAVPDAGAEPRGR